MKVRSVAVLVHSLIADTVQPFVTQSTHCLPGDLTSTSSFGCDRVDDFPFDECWGIKTLDVNPLNDTAIERVLQRLCSPAPQSYFILRRAITKGDETDLIKRLEMLQYLLKPGFHWAIEPNTTNVQVVATNSVLNGWHVIKPVMEPSILDLAHQALELASTFVEVQDLRVIALDAKDRLGWTLGTDIRGRASADAAFAFAMAGVDDSQLYQLLARVALKELQRVGKRPSFRSKYVLQIVEKMAAAGLKSGLHDLHRCAAECLQNKGEHTDIATKLLSDDFDLFSARSLNWLWRHSSKQAKESPSITSASNEANWVESLDDPSKALVVDIGCGMGVSLLGLATVENRDFASSDEGFCMNRLDWKGSNLVGCDLSRSAIGYARGVASRWGLTSRLQYLNKPAHQFLMEMESMYSGKVSLVMIQFPSPYRFQNKAEGNRQLPTQNDGFMVSEQLLATVSRLLDEDGLLLLQSNVEDVAVTMRSLAREVGFTSLSVPNPRSSLDDESLYERLPQRTIEWIEAGGERAIGEDWSAIPILPQKGATETEIACNFHGTPIHRCLLRKVPETSGHK